MLEIARDDTLKVSLLSAWFIFVFVLHRNVHINSRFPKLGHGLHILSNDLKIVLEHVRKKHP